MKMKWKLMSCLILLACVILQAAPVMPASGSGTTVDTGTLPVAPTVTSISPSSGPTAGGTYVTITGTGFVSGATVTIGVNTVMFVAVVNATSIAAITPAGTAGAQNLTVTNPDGLSGTLSGGFTYVAAIPTPTPSINWGSINWGTIRGPAIIGIIIIVVMVVAVVVWALVMRRI